MLGLFVNFLTSLLITTVAVAMATIFFCCFGKRNSIDSGDTPVKSGNGTSGSQPDANNSGVSSRDGKTSGQGKLGENGSAVQSPVNIIVDSSELGDFSAVSRETEILRSYRKPPPPKNRARQSRAPRALLKSSTENLDIFAELSEDTSNLSLGLPVTTENWDGRDSGERSASAASDGETDNSPLLRPRRLQDVIDGEAGPKREDVRSSMLADIEQTLAALHQKAEDDTQDGDQVSQDANKGAKDDDKDTGTMDDVKGSRDNLCVQTKAVSVSSRPNSHLTAAERDDSPAGPSPTGHSPLLKVKVGPPVSPKPNIRKKILTTAQRASDENTDTKEALKADGGENKGSESQPDSTTSQEQAATTTPSTSTHGENSSNRNVSTGEESFLADESDPESKKGNDSDKTNGDPRKSEEQQPKPDSAQSEKESEVSETENTSSAEDESRYVQPTDSEKASSRPSSSYDNLEGTEADKKITNSQDNVGEQPSITTKEDDAVAAGDTADTTPPLSDEPSSPESKTSNPEETGEAPEKAGEESSKDGGTSTEDRKKGIRQDSTEDPSGKGKTSRIPVRAGSKPRTVPADAEKQEETTSN